MLEFIRKRELNNLEKKLGYEFKNIELLDKALTHTSYVKGDGRAKDHNERLEFLGDAVLELVVSEKLYSVLPELDEGIMTRARAKTVCEESLYESASALGLGKILLLGRGEDKSGGREKPSILSDALESIIGAIYIDGGFESAKLFICEFANKALETALSSATTKDDKTLLQEYVQKNHLGTLKYSLVSQEGPDHDKTFVIEINVSNKPLARGSGHSKQDAGQHAAHAALELLCGDNK